MKAIFTGLVLLGTIITNCAYAGTLTIDNQLCGSISGNVVIDSSGNVTVATSAGDSCGGSGSTNYLVQVNVSGNGSVTSSPSGISCPGTCQSSFSESSSITLTPNTSGGSTFTGWSGPDCTGTGPCVLSNISAAKSATATFSGGTVSYNLAVTKAGSGGGTVTSSPSGIDCGNDCSELYADETTVTLTAAADGSSEFAGWSGACTGNTTCQVDMTEARAVTATFNNTSGVSIIDRNWPDSPQEVISLRGDEAVAIRVNTTTSTSAGGQVNTASTTGVIGTRLVTISTTPGDFDTGSLGKCSVSGLETANIRWTQNPNPPFPLNLLSCKLNVNTEYYINIKHTTCPANTDCTFYFSIN